MYVSSEAEKGSLGGRDESDGDDVDDGGLEDAAVF